MSTILNLLFFCIAFIPSVIGAISGIGGGIIIKPALDALAGLGPGETGFLSSLTVLAMSMVSLLRNGVSKTGVFLEKRRGTAMALGAVFGGLGGKSFFDFLMSVFPRAARVGAAQSLLLIVLTGFVMVYMRKKAGIVPKKIQNPSVCALLGLGLGLLSAFLGIGGGPINIMVISYFLGMDSKTTSLHSLYIIFLSQTAGISFTALSGNIPVVNPLSAISMITGGVMGGFLGSRIIRKLQNEGIDRLFFVVLIIVILLSLYNLVRFLR